MDRLRHSDERGFTLVEVMIAFTIAAVLLVVLLRSFSLGVSSSGLVSTYTEATLLAESTMDEFGTDIPLNDGAVTDRIQGRFRVATAMHLYADENTPDLSGTLLALYEFTVTVSWQEGARRRAVDLRTLRLYSAPQTPPVQPPEQLGG
jgi:general secretion pathway protein I